MRFGWRHFRMGMGIGVATGRSEIINTFAFLGDSNAGSPGDIDHADKAFGLSVPFPGCTLNSQKTASVTDPPVWTELATGSLRPFGSNMGMELTFGRVLAGAIEQPFIVKMAMTSSTLAVEWLPTATYPTVGPNLYHLWVTRMRSFGTIAGVTISLGTNDAKNATYAANFQANMAALNAAIRADLGPSVAIVWVKLNVNGSNTFTSTVRAAQVAVAAADPAMRLVDSDDLALVGANYFEDGYITLGQRCAFAILDKLGYARQEALVTPAVLGWGPGYRGSGALSPVSWGGVRANDREYMLVTTGQLDNAITTPSGWTVVANTSQTSTASVTLKQRCVVYERLVTQAMLDANSNHTALTTIADTNDFLSAKIYAVRGPSGAPTTDVSSGAVSNAFTTTLALTGATTTAPNSLIMMFTGGFTGFSTNNVTVVNAGLTNVVEQQDGAYEIVSDYQMNSLTTGTKAAAGATGTATVTAANNVHLVGATVAVKP